MAPTDAPRGAAHAACPIDGEGMATDSSRVATTDLNESPLLTCDSRLQGGPTLMPENMSDYVNSEGATQPLSCVDFLRDAATLWCHDVCIEDNGNTTTYGQLWQTVKEIVDWLKIHSALPATGGGIGIVAPNGASFLASVFASLACGCTVMPIAEDTPAGELERILKNAPLHALLVARPSGSASTTISRTALSTPLSSFQHERTNFSLFSIGEDKKPFTSLVPDPAFVRFTSGTTGKAKGVLISHRTVQARTAAAVCGLTLTRDDKVIWVLPMAYHFVVSLMTFVRFGIPIVCVDEGSPETLADQIEHHGGTFMYGAPWHYESLLTYAADTPDKLSSLKTLLCTSTRLRARLAHRFKQVFGKPLSQVYGIIEIGLPAGNFDVSRRPDAIGEALPGYQMEVLDAQGRSCGYGELGRLAFRGPGMFDAYLVPEALREEVLDDGWFITGDLAEKSLEHGVIIRGRESSVCQVADKKVFPEEIEEVLGSHPLVEVCRVTTLQHIKEGSDSLVAEVVPSQEAVELSSNREPVEDQLFQYLRGELPAWKLPTEVTLVHEIGRTLTGKIRRVS